MSVKFLAGYPQERDYLVIESRQTELMHGDQLRLEAAATIARNVHTLVILFINEFRPCTWLRRSLRYASGGYFCRLDQFHIAARHQFLDIQQDDHAAIHRTQSLQISNIQTRAEFGRRPDLFWFQLGHI